jgi:hypothetical protein
MNFKKPNPLVKLLTKVVMSEPPLDPSLFVRSGLTTPRYLLSMIDLALLVKRPESHLIIDYEDAGAGRLNWNIEERLP